MKRRLFMASLAMTPLALDTCRLAAAQSAYEHVGLRPDLPTDHPEFRFYPVPAEIDAWVEKIWSRAETLQCRGELTGITAIKSVYGVQQFTDAQYVKFTPARAGHSPFYGFWQPAPSGPAPLLVHVPGYGPSVAAHPDLEGQGYNILEIEPLGYIGPDGMDMSKQKNGTWPVLPDTVTSGGARGYADWLLDCILAIRWAQARPEVLPDRVSFFGTSQGAGGSLLLGSLYHGRGVRCVCADLPFLTNFPASQGRVAYDISDKALAEMPDKALGWRGLGFADTLSHAFRLDIPVLLTAGTQDPVVSIASAMSLFERLPQTRSLTVFEGLTHTTSPMFVNLAAAWFRSYA